MGKFIRGGVAGLVATVAMSLYFVAAKRQGRIGTLPPEVIIRHLLPKMSKAETKATAAAAHFAYGTGGGAVFGLVLGRWNGLAPLFGLMIWAISYQGWVPALGILPPAHRDKPSRKRTILTAHLIFGVSLGLVNALLNGAAGPRHRL